MPDNDDKKDENTPRVTGQDPTSANDLNTEDIDISGMNSLDRGESANPNSPSPYTSTGESDSYPDVTPSSGVSDESSEDERLFDEFLEIDPIFTDKEVLRPSYTPKKLPHRDSQVNAMARVLVPALRGDTPSNILIYGKTGTGKTASAKYVANELQTTSQKSDVPCKVEYINCEVVDTQYRVLATLAKEFGRDDVPMTGWPTDRVYKAFFDAVDSRERVAVVMLDEIDKLVEKSGDDTLYNLSRMNSDLENARVSIIGISNDVQFKENLDPRVKSSLGEEELGFPTVQREPTPGYTRTARRTFLRGRRTHE